MPLRSCLAIALAAAIVSPLPAAAQPSDLQSMALGASFVVAIPFSLFVPSGEAASGALKDSIGDRKQWTVEAVRPQGEKTIVALRSEDRQLRLDLRLDAKLAREQQLQVGDAIVIEAVGKTGHLVKKGRATIGLLADPAGGMIHSKARN